MPELLPFIMQTESFHEHSIRQSKGSVNPYINFSDLTWYEFLLPPLDEQRRIAELFSACEHTINSHRTLATEADRTYLARLLCLFVPQTKRRCERLHRANRDAMGMDAGRGVF